MTQGSWHSDASFLQFVRYQSPPMSNPSFDHPNLNSPYECPRRHWEPASDGQPTQRIIENRRRAEFITPMPKPKERKGSAKQVERVLDEGKGLSGAQQQYDPAAIINQICGPARRPVSPRDNRGLLDLAV